MDTVGNVQDLIYWPGQRVCDALIFYRIGYNVKLNMRTKLGLFILIPQLSHIKRLVGGRFVGGSWFTLGTISDMTLLHV